MPWRRRGGFSRARVNAQARRAKTRFRPRSIAPARQYPRLMLATWLGTILALLLAAIPGDMVDMAAFAFARGGGGEDAAGRFRHDFGDCARGGVSEACGTLAGVCCVRGEVRGGLLRLAACRNRACDCYENVGRKLAHQR